jgi:hypothetical protein
MSTTSKYLPLAAFCAALLALAAATASAKQPSDRRAAGAERAVGIAQQLEADPLGQDATKLRKQLYEWLNSTPDYMVTVCDILGPEPKGDVPYGQTLMLQYMFGNLAYQIRNPKDNVESKRQIAGVESMLNAYEKIMARDPRARNPHLDGLLRKHRMGILRSHMRPLIADACPPDGGR